MELEISNKRARLQHLKTNKVAVTKRTAKRLFQKWKWSLRSQMGKGQGRYRIDRGAESVIYDVLSNRKLIVEDMLIIFQPLATSLITGY